MLEFSITFKRTFNLDFVTENSHVDQFNMPL